MFGGVIAAANCVHMTCCSAQDLKDFARQAGNPIVSQVDKFTGVGIIEYANAEDVRSALRTLDGRDFNGSRVRIFEDRGGGSARGGGGGGRGYGGGGGGGGGGYGRDEPRGAGEIFSAIILIFGGCRHVSLKFTAHDCRVCSWRL